MHCDWIKKKWFGTHLQSYFEIDIDIEDEKCIKFIKICERISFGSKFWLITIIK